MALMNSVNSCLHRFINILLVQQLRRCYVKYITVIIHLKKYLLQEALAIVLDVGPGMCQGPEGEATFLELSRTAINMILQRKV